MDPIIISRLEELRLIPVVTITDIQTAYPVAQALIDGNLPIIEITFRSNEAEAAIQQITNIDNELIVGAGTVININQAKRARDAGARFIVSPGFSRTVIEWCLNNKLTVFPGITTPSELMAVLEYGIKIVKFFPAETFGGLSTLNALSTPFPNVQFIPTGGISLNNLLTYLSFPPVLACGGSWIASDKLIQMHDYQKITIHAQDALKLIQTEIKKRE